MTTRAARWLKRIEILRIEVPPSPVVLALLAFAFLAPGLTGHGPWKTLDLVSIDIAYRMHASGDWLVPRMAGELWFEDAPLYHWLALLFGKAFRWGLEFHDAARLASGLCMLVAVGCLYAAARSWSVAEERAQAAAAAVLLPIGSMGLFIHAHEAIPELAMLAATSVAFTALSKAPAAGKKVAAALRAAGLGIALGASFLSSGLAAPISIVAATLAVVCSSDEWRTRSGIFVLLAAGAIGALLAASWPLALWLREPQLFSQWTRHLSVTHGPFLENLRYFLVTSSWFLWPAWPLGFWALWSRPHRWRETSVVCPLAALLAGFLVLTITGPLQDTNTIVLLAPIALLAAQGVPKLLRGAAAALDWFGVTTFAFFAGVIWFTYGAMLTGFPARIARNFLRVTPGFTQPFELLSIILAVLLAVGWFYIVFRTTRGPTRSLLRWAAGVTLLWGTFAALWMPWVDYQRSYRPVALQIKSRLPAGAVCVSGRNLGNAQRAAFDYHAGIVTRPFDPKRPRACPLLLVQGEPRHELDPGKGWVKIADVGRPGDKSERYRLYRVAQ